MPISLAPDLERLVRDKLESGQYRSEDEILREALQLLIHRDRALDIHIEALAVNIEELRGRIATGLEQLERDDRFPPEALFADLWGGDSDEP